MLIFSDSRDPIFDSRDRIGSIKHLKKTYLRWWGLPFVTRETRNFLTQRRIAFSTSPLYHPRGNNQCERVYHTVWTCVSNGVNVCIKRCERVYQTVWTCVSNGVENDQAFAARCTSSRRKVGICFVGSFACCPFFHVHLDEWNPPWTFVSFLSQSHVRCSTSSVVALARHCASEAFCAK